MCVILFSPPGRIPPPPWCLCRNSDFLRAAVVSTWWIVQRHLWRCARLYGTVVVWKIQKESLKDKFCFHTPAHLAYRCVKRAWLEDCLSKPTTIAGHRNTGVSLKTYQSCRFMLWPPVWRMATTPVSLGHCCRGEEASQSEQSGGASLLRQNWLRIQIWINLRCRLYR